MENLENKIAEWRKQMADGMDPSALDELESHLRDDIENELRSGAAPQQAFATAVRRIGPASVIVSEFKKVAKTRWELLRKLKELFGGSQVSLPSLSNFTASARQSLDFAPEEA